MARRKIRWIRQHNLHMGTVRHGLEMTWEFQSRGAGTVYWCFLMHRFSRIPCRFPECWDCCGQLAQTTCIMGESSDCPWQTRRFFEQNRFLLLEVTKNGMRTSRTWHKRSWSRTDFARSACESRTLEVGGWCADRVFGPCWSQTKLGSPHVYFEMSLFLAMRRIDMPLDCSSSSPRDMLREYPQMVSTSAQAASASSSLLMRSASVEDAGPSDMTTRRTCCTFHLACRLARLVVGVHALLQGSGSSKLGMSVMWILVDNCSYRASTRSTDSIFSPSRSSRQGNARCSVDDHRKVLFRW